MTSYWMTAHTEWGDFVVAEQAGRLTALRLPGDDAPGIGVMAQTPFLCQAARQLIQYLRGERRAFDLPLEPSGTPFQRAVWAALGDIPYGQTRSYGEIARAIGNPRAHRAVGMANHANPIAIVIPCHRVIGAKGALIGYGGGLTMKRRLLELEQNFF